jgi:UDP-N-acetylmuramoyl-tripeptide--D-alanyl-D-alanine ligase
MEISKLYDLFNECDGVTTDSRMAQPGALFFALKGDRFNGNEYALQALSNGCRYAVVDDPVLKGNHGCVLVPDVMEALQQLARYHRLQSDAIFIGITGSNGKTTTKELIAAVLSEKYRVWYTQGNLNNHIGVPLTLLSMPPQTEIAVIEMGANHIGEIALLTSIAQPDFGIITNVGKAHLEGFGSFEGVKVAKGELYQFLKVQGAPAFVNRDNVHLKEMLGDGLAIGFGTTHGGLVTGKNATASPFLEFEWQMDNTELWHTTSTRLSGLYNFENALAAVCVGVYFNVEPWLINQALGQYQPVNNRSQLTATAHNKVLIDAYNANPSSMSAALVNFNALPGENKVLILGGMKELGSDTYQEHAAVVSQVAGMTIQHCYLVGPEFKGFVSVGGDSLSWYESTEALLIALQKKPVRNALVLVKGSRSNRLETILGAL